MRLNDKVYNWLKWIAIILLPALSVLLSTVLPLYKVDGETVKIIVITINAVGVFIGTLIGISQVSIAQETAQEEFYETDTEEDLDIDLSNDEEPDQAGDEG